MNALHPQVEALLEQFRAAEGPALWELSVDDARIAAGGMMALGGTGPDVAKTEDVAIPGPAGAIPARLYTPSAETPTSVLVWFHGGGWVLGGIDGHDALCRALAVATGALVVNPDYRLAPEHRYPAAADDALAVVEWVAFDLADGRPIVVGGDSAGANLAAVVALRARDIEDGPAIAHQVLFYPVTDCDLERASYLEHEDSLPVSKKDMVFFWDHYAPNPNDRTSVHASPLRAESHAGLPPAYVAVSGHDPLRDEGLAYAQALADAGVAVKLDRHDDMPHGFLSFLAVLDTAPQTVREVGDYLKAQLG